MQIILNGKHHELTPDTTISALLADSGMADQRLAVEVNGTIVPRSNHAERRLQTGDQVEIIHAVGGG